MSRGAVGLLLVTGLAISGAGCAQTLRDAREAKGSGTVVVYFASFDEIWELLPMVANDLDLSVAGAFKERGLFMAQRDATYASWGERVAVFVEPVEPRKTKVEVVSKNAITINITATNFEPLFHERLVEVIREQRRENAQKAQ